MERAGWHPFIGLLHSGRGRAPELVLDLMEEFRQPAVDHAVLSLVARRSSVRVNDGGRLSVRSRRLATTAFARAAVRLDRGVSLADRVMTHAIHLGGAIAGHHSYAGYRARW